MSAPANVVRLGSRFACTACGAATRVWQIEGDRFCRDHVMDELERLYAETPYPFTPPLVLPVRGAR